MRIEVRAKATYEGHSVNNKGIIKLSLQFTHEQLDKTLPLSATTSQNLNVQAKIQDKKVDVGEFMLNEYRITRDGEQIVKLNGTTENVDLDAINLLASTYSEANFIVRLFCDVIIDED